MLHLVPLVYVLLVVLYSSFLTPFVIMFSVPLALVGALYGLALTHQTLNLFSLIGIIMLLRPGREERHPARRLREHAAHTRAARRSTRCAPRAGIRLRPIVMTTASMVFGMLPLALGLAEGAEFRALDGHRPDRRPAELPDPDALSGPGHLRMGRRRDRTSRRPSSASCRTYRGRGTACSRRIRAATEPPGCRKCRRAHVLDTFV